MDPVQILETTLRDGSYAVDFQFSVGQTAMIAHELEKAGFGLIEVGHGVGIGATRAGRGRAKHSDLAYLRAARGALTKAKFGMFCIPGIAQLEELQAALSEGMSFTRIGTNVTEVEDSAPFIEMARTAGIFVTSNLMKSYVLPPKEFAKAARFSESYGSEMIYIVDSAGGMLPNELRDYIHATKDVCGIPFGYHGHNNLGLAVSNTLLAVEEGALIVDSSLQGMGRGAGNAPTEILVYLLRRAGHELASLKAKQILEIGQNCIRPLMKQGIDDLGVVTGAALFHSSNLPALLDVAVAFDCDPRDLVEEMCKHDKVEAPRELLTNLAGKL